MTGLVLYAHPYGHVLDELVPMGAVALMNRIPAPKRGRFAWELSESDIQQASVLAMDLHWYFSIAAVGWIAAAVKALRPDLPIVLGGITASFYARHLIETLDIDHVVQGDGEGAFPALVDALRQGHPAPRLPNVWSRGGSQPLQVPVTPRQYDANDYLTLDWFPALAAHTRANHAAYAARPFWGRMDRYHPYLPLNRGCRFPCNGCFGSYQRDVFGPGQVDRSAESFAATLDAAEAHPDYRFINLTAGTEDMARLTAWRDVFARKRDLSAYVMHFCALPSDADLDLILGGFERVCIDFTNPGDVPLPLRASGLSIAAAEDRIVQIATMLDGLEHVRVGISFMDTDPHPLKARLRSVDWQRLQLKENSEWALPRPNAATLSDDALPAWPVPQVERRGLTPPQRVARRAAKVRQASAFTAVSTAHARYTLARALAPGLHPVLEEAPMCRIDGAPRTALAPMTPALAAFTARYTAVFREWSVRQLDRVGVVVSALSAGETGLAVRGVGVDLGPATLRYGLRGIEAAWAGPLPVGTVAVMLRPLLDPGDGSWLDPGDLDGLPWRAIAVPEGTVEVSLSGVFSQNRAALCVGETTLSWSPLTDHPPTPLAPARAGKQKRRQGGMGPENLVDGPWPDDRWPSRIVRVLDGALRRGLVAGWRGQSVARARSWVRCELTGPEEATVRLFVLPPGERACAWQGEHMRMMLQDPAPKALTDRIQALLSGLDKRG
ncbi:MAG: cobalamin-dependent protein [Myxococcota bacterium]|nr:cobalamin-dependent protein [Myxococcota bacterium]